MKKLLFIFTLFAYSTIWAQVNLYEGLVAYYPLDGNANDYSDSLNHGVNIGAVSANGINEFPNTCYDFSNGSIEIPSGIMLPDSNMTLSVWVKPLNLTNANDGFSSYFNLFFPNNSYPDVDFHLFEEYSSGGNYFTPSCTLVVQGDPYLDWDIHWAFDEVAELNEWNHLLYEFNQDSSTFYLNGQVKSVNKRKYLRPTLQFEKGVIGNDFPGLVDELIIYNRVLTTDEKLALSQKQSVVLSSTSFSVNKLHITNPIPDLLDLTTFKGSVKIHNTEGIVVYSGTPSLIDTKFLDSGVYILSIESSNQVYTQRLVKL